MKMTWFDFVKIGTSRYSIKSCELSILKLQAVYELFMSKETCPCELMRLHKLKEDIFSLTTLDGAEKKCK